MRRSCPAAGGAGVKASIFLDASVVMAVITDEPIRPRLIDRTRGEHASAATSLPYEIGNGLSSNLRRKKLTAEQAVEAMALYRQMKIEFAEVDLEASLECCLAFNLYAYDAYVLTTARRSGVPLFTLDHKMQMVAGRMGIELVEWPS